MDELFRFLEFLQNDDIERVELSNLVTEAISVILEAFERFEMYVVFRWVLGVGCWESRLIFPQCMLQRKGAGTLLQWRQRLYCSLSLDPDGPHYPSE